MQGNKWFLALLTSVAAVSLTSPAMAACMSAPDGWYFEANVGSSHLSNDNFPGDSSSSGVGFNGNFGYKFMPYGAIEAGVARYPETEISDLVTGDLAATVKHYSYDLAAKAILPISDSGFEGFAKLGVVRLVSKTTINNNDVASSMNIGISSNSSTGIYLGIGGQYYISPEFAVVAQWQRAHGNVDTGSEDLFSIGVSILFV